MQEFLNNPVALGLLIFGLFLTGGSVAMRWRNHNKNKKKSSEGNFLSLDLRDHSALEPISQAIEAGEPFSILVNGMPCTVLALHFGPKETMPERVQAMADELGIKPADVGYRALTEYMGQYGLKQVPPGFEAKNLEDLFTAHGLLKP